jgi:putative flippase GtrA
MTDTPRSSRAFARVFAPIRQQAMMLKAVCFASIGVVNATVNYVIFWLVLRLLGAVPTLAGSIGSLAAFCGCASAENAGIIVANVIAWSIAVSGSYVMNSLITFAAESGRKLTWRAYTTFAVSGVLGLIADTATLLIAKEFLPIMLAKLVAIGAGFVVNFSMSHFVVFRPRGTKTRESTER